MERNEGRGARDEGRGTKDERRGTRDESSVVRRLSSLVFLLFSVPLFAQTSKPLSGLNVEGLQQGKGKELRWKDNPFVQPVESLDVQDLHLTAVVAGDRRSPELAEGDSACLINGEVLRVGDKIGFSEVVHIEKDHVVLRNENGIFGLSLKGQAPPPPAPIEPPTGEKTE